MLSEPKRLAREYHLSLLLIPLPHSGLCLLLYDAQRFSARVIVDRHADPFDAALHLLVGIEHDLTTEQTEYAEKM